MIKNNQEQRSNFEKIVGAAYFLIAIFLVFSILFDRSFFNFFKEFTIFDVLLIAAVTWVLSASDVLFRKDSRILQRINGFFAFSFMFLLFLLVFNSLGFFRLVEFEITTIILFIVLLAKTVFLVRKDPEETYYLIGPALYGMAFGFGPAMLYAILQNSILFYAWIAIYCVFQGVFLVFKEKIKEMQKAEKNPFSKRLFIIWAVWTIALLWAILFYVILQRF